MSRREPPFWEEVFMYGVAAILLYPLVAELIREIRIILGAE